MLPSVQNLGLFRNNGSGDKDFKKQAVNENDDESSKEEEEGEDCSLHRKRLRTFPSERNQFVVHVFYRFDDTKNLDILTDLFDEFSSEKSSSVVTFEPEPHISFVDGHYAVQYHQIEPVLAELGSLIQSFRKFTVCLSHIRQFSNQENTRKFIVICDKRRSENSELPVSERTTNLKYELIRSIHQILGQYRSKIPTTAVTDSFDEDRGYSFHTSIAWYLPKNDDNDDQIGQQICDNVSEYFKDKAMIVEIDQITVKIGHRTREFSLL